MGSGRPSSELFHGRHRSSPVPVSDSFAWRPAPGVLHPLRGAPEDVHCEPPPRGAFVGHEREGTSYLFASFPGQQCCNGWVGYSFRNDRIIIWQDTHRIEVVPADLPSITDVQLSLLDSQLELRLLK